MKIIIYARRPVYDLLYPCVQALLHLHNSQSQIYDHETDIIYHPSDIFIFIQSLPSLYIGKPNVLLYNIEHLTRPDYQEYVLNILNHNRVIDYSQENIAYIKKYHHGKYQHLFLPFVFCDRYIFPSLPKKYPFVFIGLVTERRKKILDGIEQHYPIHYINHNFNHKTLALDEILQGFILLNIHQKDNWLITETFRCYPALYNKMLIICEESINMDITNSFWLNKFMIFAKYDDMIKKSLEVYQNYHYYFHDKYRDFDPQKIKEETQSYLSHIEKDLS